jgi:predicted  nucleic acid-binding Zn-ribbon protein
MIWALLAAYFLSGGGVSGGMLTPASVKQLSARTEEVIVDSARAEAAQQTLAELRKEVKAFQKTFTKSGKQLNKSYKDHADGGDDALDILQELNTDWEQAQQRAIDLRFELRDSMTEEEWAALFAGD